MEKQVSVQSVNDFHTPLCRAVVTVGGEGGSGWVSAPLQILIEFKAITCLMKLNSITDCSSRFSNLPHAPLSKKQEEFIIFSMFGENEDNFQPLITLDGQLTTTPPYFQRYFMLATTFAGSKLLRLETHCIVVKLFLEQHY